MLDYLPIGWHDDIKQIRSPPTTEVVRVTQPLGTPKVGVPQTGDKR